MHLKLTFILVITFGLGFSQTEKDDYEIYSKVINKSVMRLEKNIEIYNIKSIKTVVVIEKLKYEFKKDHLMFNEFKTDSSLTSLFYTMTKDILIKKRFLSDENLVQVLPEFNKDFTYHPNIDFNLINLEYLNIASISFQEYENLTDNSTNSYGRRWRKVNKKYKHSIVFSLSKIKYLENYASVYYWYDCGKLGFCKNENVMVLEKVNGKWKEVSNIILWISD